MSISRQLSNSTESIKPRINSVFFTDTDRVLFEELDGVGRELTRIWYILLDIKHEIMWEIEGPSKSRYLRRELTALAALEKEVDGLTIAIGALEDSIVDIKNEWVER